MKHLAIYVRLSKEDEDSNSIKNQIREGKDFAKKKNFKHYTIYNEGEGLSGSLEIEDRPQLDKLIKDIIEDKIQAVWFRNENRLERNGLTFQYFVKYAKKKDLDVYFGDKNKVDFNDPSTMLQSTILSAINTYAIELQSFQTKKVLLKNAKEGKFSSFTPYGYTKDDQGYLIIDKEEAEIVKRIYNESLNGVGSTTIATKLNEEGVKTRYSKMDVSKKIFKRKNRLTGTTTEFKKSETIWRNTTLLNIIKNPLYKGEKRYNDIIIKVPPIVSEKLWNDTNDNLPNNKNNGGKKVKHQYLLRTALKCGRCGKNYYGKIIRLKKDKNHKYYVCASKRLKEDINCGNKGIRIDFIEELIWNEFFKKQELIRLINEHFNEVDSSQKVTELINEKDSIEKSIKRSENEKNKVIKLLVKGLINDGEGEQQLKRIRIEINSFNKELININQQIKTYENTKISKADTTKELKSIEEKIGFNDKKEIIKKYINQIIINSDDEYFTIDINFNLPIGDTRIIVDNYYNNATMVESRLDNEVRKLGYKNCVDWQLNHVNQDGSFKENGMELFVNLLNNIRNVN